MKRALLLVIVASVVACVTFVPANAEVYDDFSSPKIDSAKWLNDEVIRKIDAGKLILGVRNSVNASSPEGTYVYSNIRRNVASITALQADVTLREFANNQSAWPRVALGGRFYNDGTVGGGYLGDVRGEVQIGGVGTTEPYAMWQVIRHTADSVLISADEILAEGRFALPVAVGTTHTLAVSWDSTSLQFRVDDEMHAFTPASPVNPANRPSRQLWARISQVAGKEASITAAFDNVSVNGSLFDDFAGSALNMAKWGEYELDREVAGGRFHELIRGDVAPMGTFPYTWRLFMADPATISAISAEVTPVALQQGYASGKPQLRLQGRFANAGGTDPDNDLYGAIRIGINQGQTTADCSWIVMRGTSGNETLLLQETFNYPITLGTPYRLFIGFDGRSFNFAVNDEKGVYSPGLSGVTPAVASSKNLAIWVPDPAGAAITMEAFFDNVMRWDRFTDVAFGYWADPFINAIHWAGYTSGYGGTDEFKPDLHVSRDQMAAFIIRAKAGEPSADYCSAGSPFPDVDQNGWACRYVRRLSELGITTGVGGTGLYMPATNVTREQMAAFIIRALEGEPDAGLCTSGSPFADVDQNGWACRYIKRLKDLNITTGYGGTNEYRPTLEVTRAEMAAFLARAFLGM